MAKGLFLRQEDLKKNTFLRGVTDPDTFIHYVSIAQETHLLRVLGTNLYNRLQDMIEDGTINSASNSDYKSLLLDFVNPMLVHYSLVTFLPFASFMLSNSGVQKHKVDNADRATDEEVNNLVDRHRDFAESYRARFNDHMSFYNSRYPEYNQHTNDDVIPNRRRYSSGIYLTNGYEL